MKPTNTHQTLIALVSTLLLIPGLQAADKTPVERYLDYRSGKSTDTDSANKRIIVDGSDTPSKLQLKIRRSFDEAVRGIVKGKGLDEANPALFSYAHDFSSQADTWTARGAVALQSDFLRITESGPFADAWVIPGISFDRLETNSDDGTEVNSLVFRLGANATLANQSQSTLHEFRLNAMYATDFSFDSAIVGGELDWEPKLLNLWGSELYRDINKEAKPYRYRTILHSEFGEIVDAGGNPNLTEGESFFRIGPKLEAEVELTEILNLSARQPIELFGSYAYLWGIDGSPGSSDYWKVGTRFQLDDSGRLSIEANYEQGDLPLVNQAVDTVTVALGVKF